MTTARPILFSAPMVMAILERRKTQTRRKVSFSRLPHATIDENDAGEPWPFWEDEYGDWHAAKCPYGESGGILYVRESWATDVDIDHCAPRNLGGEEAIVYIADGMVARGPAVPGKKRPGIFLPKWASRIHLRVTGVRIERLQSISEESAEAEGAVFHDGYGVGHSGWRHDPAHGFVYPTARDSFAALWKAINGDDSLLADPWVWVVSFEREERK